jgi:hypothetical protein
MRHTGRESYKKAMLNIADVAYHGHLNVIG